MKFKNYLDESENLLFDENNAKQIADKIEKNIDAPVVKANISKLGGNPTIMLAISLDPKKEWANNIFENSRYLRFSIDPDPSKSNVELFTKSHKIEQKFRKQKAKTTKDVINKINKYIDNIK